MQFKNLSVAKKIWLLMLVVMGTMLTAGIAMTSYMTNVEDRLRDDILSVDERMRVVVELRGAIETAASFLVAGNLAQDPASMDFFDRKYQEARDRSANLLDRTAERLATEEGKALMRNINDHRNKLLASAEMIAAERRNDGDVAGLVQSQLVPAVTSYLQELNAMVALQEKLRANTLNEGHDARIQAMTLAGVALVLVFAFGLIMAAWLVRQINAPLSRAVDLANSIADGDLSRDVHDDRQDELGQLLRSLNAMTQKLRAVVGEVRNGVDSVSSAASQIASGNQDLSARTEQTAANLEETAASVEELTATVTQSADTARQANQLAATAVQAAERGGEVVSQVVMSMDQINSSSRKISDIIGVIDGIAFQTNILALNAAVEAARAGEQGRGFAVVAGEVRSLAQRSAEAAKEIKALITASVTNVDIGAEQVAQAGESMQEIVASVRRVTDLIGEISASVSEQRDGFAQVNQAVSNLDQMTQQNAALVEESSAAATSMNEQAQRLSEVVSMFNVGQSGSQPMAVRRAPTLTSSASATAATTKAAAPAVQTAARKPLAAPATSHKAAAKPAAPATKPSAAPQLAKPAAPVASKTTSNDDDWETF